MFCEFAIVSFEEVVAKTDIETDADPAEVGGAASGTL